MAEIDDYWGRGGVHPSQLSDPSLKLLRRAIREGWPVPDEAREKFGEIMKNIMLDDKVHPQTRVNAARTLLVADKMNRDDLIEAAHLQHDYIAAQQALGQSDSTADEGDKPPPKLIEATPIQALQLEAFTAAAGIDSVANSAGAVESPCPNR